MFEAKGQRPEEREWRLLAGRVAVNHLHHSAREDRVSALSIVVQKTSIFQMQARPLFLTFLITCMQAKLMAWPMAA